MIKNLSKDTPIPSHVVLFPDGNRRWAKQHGFPTLRGHLRGKNHFQDFMLWCKKRGVKVITVFGFSTENWNRSKEEVNYLMDLFERYLGDPKSIEKFQQEHVRVAVIGQKERLRPSLQKVIAHIEEITKNNKDFYLNLGVSYGGRWDITQAVKKILENKIPFDKITEEIIDQYLSTSGQPAPDLVIRPGGEKRFSNFLLWQSAYAELYFSPKYWPDFTEQDLDDAFHEYAKRTRRFGH